MLNEYDIPTLTHTCVNQHPLTCAQVPAPSNPARLKKYRVTPSSVTLFTMAPNPQTLNPHLCELFPPHLCPGAGAQQSCQAEGVQGDPQ